MVDPPNLPYPTPNLPYPTFPCPLTPLTPPTPSLSSALTHRRNRRGGGPPGLPPRGSPGPFACDGGVFRGHVARAGCCLPPGVAYGDIGQVKHTHTLSYPLIPCQYTPLTRLLPPPWSCLWRHWPGETHTHPLLPPHTLSIHPSHTAAASPLELLMETLAR